LAPRLTLLKRYRLLDHLYLYYRRMAHSLSALEAPAAALFHFSSILLACVAPSS